MKRNPLVPSASKNITVPKEGRRNTSRTQPAAPNRKANATAGRHDGMGQMQRGVVSAPNTTAKLTSTSAGRNRRGSLGPIGDLRGSVPRGKR